MWKTSLQRILLRNINWTAKAFVAPCSSNNARFASSDSFRSSDSAFDDESGDPSGRFERSNRSGGFVGGNRFSSKPDTGETYRSGDNGGFRNNGFGDEGGYRGGFNRNRQQVSGFGGRGDRQFAGSNLRPIKYDNMEPIKKNFYQEHPSVAARSQEEIDAYYKQHEVTLKGKDIPRPIISFAESNFPEPIQNQLKNFNSPTIIQAISWPLAMSGRDIISIAKTGSGKTLGFILPAIMHIVNQPAKASGDGPAALVVLPTRELAQQVELVARSFCRAMDLTTACVFGGASRNSQASMLSRGVDILVGTPGRLMDFLESGHTNLRRCSFLVLDEADRMLDMGFEPQIRKIVGQIRPDRQTMMFSATWPKEIRNLAADFQTDPVFLNVGSLELSANPNIKQNVEVIEEHQKAGRLAKLLEEIRQEKDNKTLIFVQTKRAADHLVMSMRRNSVPALALHGDKSQTERDWVLNEFRKGTAQILVATDVAARGLDVNDIKVVINYDYAKDAEDYVHRIGRTARGEKKGTSYTFLTYLEGSKAEGLIQILIAAKQEVPEDLKNLANRVGGGNNYNSRYQRQKSFSDFRR